MIEFAVIEIVWPAEARNRPFKIIETNMTMNGPRTRVCDGAYAEKKDALAAIDDFKAKRRAGGVKS